ncbi:MAG: hypothetical protein K9K36_07135 [Desulfarculaceae bacterium]|nr:hypothetical protein [Desulfarculaceae bacterium]
MISKSPQAPSGGPLGPAFPQALLAGFGPDCLAFKACARLLVELLNPGGVGCPACGSTADPSPQLTTGGRVRCTHCGRRFTAFSGTLLEGCKISLQQAALIFLLLALGQDNATVATLAGVSAETARSWRAKLEAA